MQWKPWPVAAAALMLSLARPCGAQLPIAQPQVVTPFAGDPRLEPLPAPLNLASFTAFGDGIPVSMHFPPRVNGQNEGAGDRHSDLWVLFDVSTGRPVNQAPVIDAVPMGAAPVVSTLTARSFSATWAVHALTVSATYDPSNLATRIDSAEKVRASTLAINDFQTNIFVNGPVIPAGSTVDPAKAAAAQAFYEGQLVSLVFYEVDDGPFQPQTLFRFVDPTGAVLGAPYLVASHLPGDPFYSPVWEIFSVHVPSGFDVTTLKSETDVRNTRFRITSAGTGIRVNGPVVAVNGVAVPPEDFMSLLAGPDGSFSPQNFPRDITPAAFKRRRTFVITASTPAAGAAPLVARPLQAASSSFPAVDPTGRGNVIPLLLSNPFQLRTSAPASTGKFVRIDQADLDSAYLNNVPPLLPAAIEANFASLISAGLLGSGWAPGGTHSYQERLSLVGRALVELVWQPEQGANPKDVTSCHSCHSQPAVGGASRGLFTFLGKAPAATGANAGSMWGSGAEELLVAQWKASGVPGITSAHGSLGTISSIRSAINGAANNHFGLQSAEFVAQSTGNPAGYDPVADPDHDGVANELSVGEVTAMTVFLMSLPVPDTASASMLGVLGVADQSVRNGRVLFRSSIDNGGAACASCHRVFSTLSSSTFLLSNPQTAVTLPIAVAFHAADQDDVNDGLAQFVGQPGLRMYGDVKLHKLGSTDSSTGTDTMKTAELWDAGSVFPYLRGGSAGASLDAAIAAHEGVYLGGIGVSRGAPINTVINGQKVTQQVVTVTNLTGSTIAASSSQPIRLVLTGPVTPGITAFNAAGAAPDGSFRQGAFWVIRTSIAAGASAQVALQFTNPNSAAVQYNLAIQDFKGASEAVASIQAYKALSTSQQQDIVNFLRAQLAAGRVGEQ